MGKKFSESIRKEHRLGKEDFEGRDIYLDHLDSLDGETINGLLNKHKDDSIALNYELIKLLLHGEDFVIDLDIEKDRKLIDEVMSKPDKDVLKIILEVVKMIYENIDMTLDFSETINGMGSKAKEFIENSSKAKKTKDINDMNEDELREYIKNKDSKNA